MSKKVFLVFHNESNFDYHFIMKELSEEFKGQFSCLGENTEKCISFQLRYKKKLKEFVKKRRSFSKNHVLQIKIF